MSTSFDVIASRARCLEYRRRILDISQRGPAHIAPALSCLEMVDVIYNGLKRQQDVFIMSKGHGCLAQYVVLENLGVMSLDGVLGGHPDRGNPGIEASTGSLGHGLGMAVGMAYAELLKGSDTRIYVIISDGELQEGSTWEAIQMAANLRLDNLLLFIDCNNFGGLERISDSHHALYPIIEKFDAFCWETYETNGHNAIAMYNAVNARYGGAPVVFIGHTIKGRGVAFMENVAIWHYRSPNKDEYATAIHDLSEVAS